MRELQKERAWQLGLGSHAKARAPRNRQRAHAVEGNETGQVSERTGYKTVLVHCALSTTREATVGSDAPFPVTTGPKGISGWPQRARLGTHTGHLQCSHKAISSTLAECQHMLRKLVSVENRCNRYNAKAIPTWRFRWRHIGRSLRVHGHWFPKALLGSRAIMGQVLHITTRGVHQHRRMPTRT